MSTSTPSRRSALSGDRSTRAGNTATGRRFAYTPSCARNASRPNSGLKWRGAWSSEGSPTAPSNTASARATAARVSSGNGSPAAATPAAPIGKRRSVNSIAKRSPAASSARSACAMTSGPIPSPGSTAIEYCFTTFPLSRFPFPGFSRTPRSGLPPAKSARFRRGRGAASPDGTAPWRTWCGTRGRRARAALPGRR